MGEALGKAGQEAEKFEKQAEALLNQLFPVDRMTREFNASVGVLEQLLARGDLTTEQFREALERLSAQFEAGIKSAEGFKDTVDKTADSVVTADERMREAMLESTRILERSFTSMWSGILSGADNAFDSIVDGFRDMLGNLIHEATTRPIVLNIQQAFDGDPGTSVDFAQLGADFARFAGIIAGASLGGGGQGASIGAGIGSIIGQAAGAKFLTVLGGTFAGPVGAIAGALLGGLIGGLFDKKRPPILDISGFSRAGLSNSDDDTSIDSIFGTTFLRSRRIDASDVKEFAAAIQEFDETIAAFLTDNQISAISESLQDWQLQLEGDAITLEAFLESRFGRMLTTFSDHIQEFVNRGGDLESQVERLAVGLAVDEILAENQELFDGRTAKDFLDVVDAFATGTKTIGEAFTEVLGLLDLVIQSTAVLENYAGTSALQQFNDILQQDALSLAEAVAGMQGILGEAIANFDGSPEQLNQIALLAITAREGEIKLLQQIDAIQKGLNSTLDQLRNDILGITNEKSGEQLFAEAQALLGQIASASTAEEIAALTAEFDKLIRQISPEDTAAMSDQIVGLIDQFQADANARVEEFKAAAIANAESTQAMVDDFISNIGDPLSIVADKLGDPTIPQMQAEIISDGVSVTLEDGMNQLDDTMAEGLAGHSGRGQLHRRNGIGCTDARLVKCADCQRGRDRRKRRNRQ